MGMGLDSEARMELLRDRTGLACDIRWTRWGDDDLESAISASEERERNQARHTKRAADVGSSALTR